MSTDNRSTDNRSADKVPSPQPQQRHFQRFPVERIEGTLRQPGDVRVVDMSQTGLALETEVPVESGRQHVLELAYRNQTVRLEVRVRWARPERQEEGRQIYRAGAEFLRVLEKEDTGLWDFILAEGGEGAE